MGQPPTGHIWIKNCASAVRLKRNFLCTQPARFNDLKRRLEGITHKALSDALKRLERNGLISRKVLPTQPIGVEYTITALGASLREPFAALYDWSLANSTKLAAAQAAYDAPRKHGSLESVP